MVNGELMKPCEVQKGKDREDQRKLENKTEFKVVKKVKYLGVVTLLKILCCIKITIIKMWNEIKLDLHRWGKLALSLMERIVVNKMTVLPRMFFFCLNFTDSDQRSVL